jgi:uncharacterized protein with FMN-binding domain
MPAVKDKKVANGVLALSSAAVLAIYGAGYAKTREAANRFEQQMAERRPRVPVEAREALPAAAVSVSSAALEDAPVADKTVTPSSEPLTPVATTEAAPAVTEERPRTPEPPPAPAATPASTPEEPVAAPQASTTAPPASPVAPQAPPVAPPVPASAPQASAATYKDGTYYGWGTCRHGDIQAAVVIESGRITEARVEKCLTRYSCNWVQPIPPRILSKQATTYDYVSGATESSDAFQDAVAEALSQAK